MFTAAVFITAKNWDQSKCPSSGEWINKISIQWDIIQEQTADTYCNAVGLRNILLSKISQMQIYVKFLGNTNL